MNQSIVHQAFSAVCEHQRKHHLSAVDIALRYARSFEPKRKPYLFLESLLKHIERIIITIDDIIDGDANFSSGPGHHFNETVKFVSHLSLIEAVLDYQLQSTLLFGPGLIKGKHFTRRLIQSIQDALNQFRMQVMGSD